MPKTAGLRTVAPDVPPKRIHPPARSPNRRGRRMPPAPLFHVKICGVMSAADARLAAVAGADAIGLNFVPGSPRRLDVAAAREVAEAVPPGVRRVGVFAGMPPAEMLAVARAVGLDVIQLHGHLDGTTGPVDPPAVCAALGGVPVVRAVRLGAGGLDGPRRWFAAAAAAGAAPAMALVDAAVASGALGGTGATVDWRKLADDPGLGVPLALAGGLDPDNVAVAIRATGAVAVDVASGVESEPGRKDAALVAAFVAAARAALGLG